jgi:hypothetical protein
MNMLQKRPRENENSLVASGLKDIRQTLRSQVLNVIINIGLVLDALGIAEDGQEGIAYYDELHDIKISSKDEYGTTAYAIVFGPYKSNGETVLFKAPFYESEVRAIIFKRGPWEDVLTQLAETCRVITRSINASEEKENNSSIK